jgi:endonuclease-3
MGLAGADREVVEGIVHPLGFFRTRPPPSSGITTPDISGRLPSTMEALILVPGVGRKTANVVLGECFGVPAIIVDTHVKRLSNRLDLTDESDPDRIEADLKALIPRQPSNRLQPPAGRSTPLPLQGPLPLCPPAPSSSAGDGLRKISLLLYIIVYQLYTNWYQKMPASAVEK